MARAALLLGMRQRLKGAAFQAVVVELIMIEDLEGAIIAAWERGDTNWQALLSQWVQTTALVRLKHIKRSSPERLTASTPSLLVRAREAAGVALMCVCMYVCAYD